eukprot:GHVS01037947.1.p1 GENE.GHVS01037947.1~~GHVS01037947.1.p1  ORF type:complete len:490 (-),score=89.01 GHVS01037947.1:111-1580(-)
MDNVWLMYVFTASSTLFFSVNQSAVFDNYLYLIVGGSNQWVGYAECLAGLTSLASSIPIAWAVDHYDRTKIAKWGGAFGLVATSVHALGLYRDSVGLLFASLFLLGLFWEVACSASDAILRDSTMLRRLQSFSTRRGILQTCCYASGPVFLFVYFRLVRDNVWTLRFLHYPLLVGCVVLGVSSSVLLFMFKATEVVSPRLLFSSSTHIACTTRRRRRASRLHVVVPVLQPNNNNTNNNNDNDNNDNDNVPDNVSTVDATSGGGGATSGGGGMYGPGGCSHQRLQQLSPRITNYSSLSSAGDDVTSDDEAPPPRPQLSQWQSRVPYFIAMSDLIRCVGSGMTVKFFPLFFKNDLGFLPDQVCLLFLLYAISIGVFTTMAEVIAARTGRSIASLLYSLAGVALLFWMCVETRLWLLLVVFVTRGALHNANHPIDRSLIMDYSDTKHRSRWNAVESFVSMTWSASAVLGGFLVDKHGYSHTAAGRQHQQFGW